MLVRFVIRQWCSVRRAVGLWSVVMNEPSARFGVGSPRVACVPGGGVHTGITMSQWFDFGEIRHPSVVFRASRRWRAADLETLELGRDASFGEETPRPGSPIGVSLLLYIIYQESSLLHTI